MREVSRRALRLYPLLLSSARLVVLLQCIVTGGTPLNFRRQQNPGTRTLSRQSLLRQNDDFAPAAGANNNNSNCNKNRKRGIDHGLSHTAAAATDGISGEQTAAYASKTINTIMTATGGGIPSRGKAADTEDRDGAAAYPEAIEVSGADLASRSGGGAPHLDGVYLREWDVNGAPHFKRRSKVCD